MLRKEGLKTGGIAQIKMKIAVIGPRGFPNVQGGVEAHCQRLYPRLAKLGAEITVFTRKPYVNPQIKVYKDVNLVPVYCPKRKSLEAIVYSFIGVLAAKKINPEILHVHAVGPSLIIPLARSLGMKVVMTNHGPDYKRKKWGIIANLALRLGESCGSRWAKKIICISKTIADDVKKKYNNNSTRIPNGIEIPRIQNTKQIINKYILCDGK